MANLSIISDGAVLIHNGVIEKVGTSRQVENYAQARNAREIDAAGCVVLPAFVDPDVAFAAPVVVAPSEMPSPPETAESDIRRMSRRRLAGSANALATDLGRYGVLSVGAHTLFSPDLKTTLKALRLNKLVNSRPIRIRSVFAPPWAAGDASGKHFERRKQVWMPAIVRNELASLLEIPVSDTSVDDAHALARAGAENGFNVRLRVAGVSTRPIVELACAAGAISLIGIILENSTTSRALADIGCVHVALASQLLAGKYASARHSVDDGMPIALGSGYRNDEAASLNPQFMLYAACQTLGLSAAEAIVAATYNAACSLRCSHVTGSLELGKSADICVMDVDDYHELARRAGHHDTGLVMRAGKVIYRRPDLTFD